MKRTESVFAAVTDEGVSARSLARKVGMRWEAAKEALDDLAASGRVVRVQRNGGFCYFLTDEGAIRYQGDNIPGRVFESIGRAGATVDGVAEGQGISTKSAQRALLCLFSDGRVQRAKDGQAFRYFKTKAEADAFASARRNAVVVRPQEVAVVKTKTGFDRAAQTVIPAGVKVQECPGFKGLGFREIGPVSGSFSQLGIGRYLEAA